MFLRRRWRDQRVIDRTPTTDTLPGQKSQKGFRLDFAPPHAFQFDQLASI